MLNHENFAVSLGRAVETTRARPDAIPEQKSQLRVLVALTKLGRATLVLDGDALTVEGTAVPPAFPGIRTLVHQMDGHRVREVRIAQNASAADLLALVRALAVNVGGLEEDGGLEGRLRASRATSVSVLAVREDKLAGTGRPVSVTEAFELAPILEAAEVQAAAEVPDDLATPALSLTMALQRLTANDGGGDVLDLGSEVVGLALQAMAEGRTGEAVEALAGVIELEGRLGDGGSRRSLGVVLRRLQSDEILARVALLTRDARYQAAAATVLVRAAAEGTQKLLGGADRAMRLMVTRAVGGKGAEPLTVLLVEATTRDDDEEEQEEACRALGRIGTPAALQALIKMAQPGGRFLRRKVAGPRLAAVEGLKASRSAAAIGTLERLVKDNDPQVRQAVEQALQDRPRT